VRRKGRELWKILLWWPIECALASLCERTGDRFDEGAGDAKED
jgi:hypothetical protein